MNAMENQRGSMAVEVVLLVPVMVLMVLFVVYAGRTESASLVVRQAADIGARIGSQSSRSQAIERARTHTFRELQRHQQLCHRPSVKVVVRQFHEYEAVQVTAQCHGPVDGLGALVTTRSVVQATSLEVFDMFRARQ